MQRPSMRPLWAVLFCCAASAARAADGFALGEPGYWRLVVSPYSHHFRFNAEHRPVWALGVERQRSDGWLLGATYFRNSFGQPSGFLYLGRRYEHLLGAERLFAQWSAGLMYGYKGKYQAKVPLNVDGYSPGVLVTAGWHFNRQSALALHLLGDAAVMLQLSYDFH